MKTKLVLLFLAALVVVGISGCADNFARPTPTVVLGHPHQDLARFKGRAFVLRTISTNYFHHFKGDDWNVLKPRHCLANWVYQKELRHDLEEGWRREHLDEGKKPPIPVDIVIRVVEASHGFPHAPNMVSDIHLPGAIIRTHSISNAESILLPMWTTDREIIPTDSAEIVYAIRALHSGNVAALHHYWSPGAPSWGEHLGGILPGHIYGIANPMSMAEMRSATGLTSDQLSKMCDTGGGK
jgi:hypothetical protein